MNRSLGRYIVKSLLQVIPVLLIVSLIVFVLVRVTGDPVALMLPETATAEDRAVLTQALGLDQPLHVQYVKFLGDALQGTSDNPSVMVSLLFAWCWSVCQPALSLRRRRWCWR